MTGAMGKKNLKATKETVSKVLVQAIEAMGSIRDRIPTAAVRKKLTNKKILDGLAKIGVATQSEVKELRARIDELESRLSASRRESTIKNN
jgi:polyhydroxyalkanoate synthesis regulator phasin